MTKLKDYIGKTFKGFEFEHKKHSNLPYNDIMNDFIGKDLKIQSYYEGLNYFFTDSGLHYPADLVIEQLEKQETFKPKRGDKVLVWDNEEEKAQERIFLTEIEGASQPYICVLPVNEKDFINGGIFSICEWINMKPLPEKEIAKDTLVWCKDLGEKVWQQRFYSHFVNGKHYCFIDQKKSNQVEIATLWNIVTDKNPFE
jgi:hypothetical protein